MKEKQPSKFFFYLLTAISLLLLAGDIYLVNLLLNPWEFSRHYKTYEDAVKDDTLSPGWIPEFVPNDAYDIHDSHNLSPRDQHLEFSFPSTEPFKKSIDTQAYALPNQHEKESLKTLTIKPLQSEALKSCPAIKPHDQLSYYKVSNFSCLSVDWALRRAYYTYRCCREE